MIQVGASFELKTKVTEQNTALAVGSGDVPVFATPMMMALMEGAAAQCLAQFLEEGKTSVGGNISSSHVSATPVGMEVRAVATITEVDGKKVKLPSRHTMKPVSSARATTCASSSPGTVSSRVLLTSSRSNSRFAAKAFSVPTDGTENAFLFVYRRAGAAS